jgi:ABC-2 type transport system ATP-binding protein
MHSIQISDIHHRYYKKTALASVSLDLSPGFNVILGPNGAGKSTLFALLTGLLPIQQGTITFGAQALQDYRSAIMRQLGVVFQQPTLDLNLTVQQNLTYFGALHGIGKAEVLQRCEALLTQFALKDRLAAPAKSLNQGHRRRLEIIRALIHQPQYLLLDEATVGLDADTRQLVLKILRQYVKDNQTTLLWTTHLMDEVAGDDQLILLHQGTVQAQGVTAELLADGNYPSVFAWYCASTQSEEAI